jgi:CheY-like chemotaxis protein
MANALWPTGQQEEEVFGKTILIVEDDPANAEMLHLLLQFADRSYQVTCFRSGGVTRLNGAKHTLRQ